MYVYSCACCLQDEVAFKAAAANGGMAGLINTLTGSTHGNSGTQLVAVFA